MSNKKYIINGKEIEGLKKDVYLQQASINTLLLDKINELIDAWNNQQEEIFEDFCQWENCSGGKYCSKHSLENEPKREEKKDLPFNDFLDNKYGSREDEGDTPEGQTNYCKRCDAEARKDYINTGLAHTCGLEEKKEGMCRECELYAIRNELDIIPNKCNGYCKDQPSKPSIRENLKSLFSEITMIDGGETVSKSKKIDQILDLVRKTIMEKAKKEAHKEYIDPQWIRVKQMNNYVIGIEDLEQTLEDLTK